MTGSYALEGTGLTVQFAEAADADQKPSSFLVGDTFTFSSTAPAMTNGDVLAAVDKLKEFTQEFGLIHSSLPTSSARAPSPSGKP